MKIYTGTGDEGQTGLLGGERVGKSSPRIDAIGAVDELNAALGLALVHGEDAELFRLQCWLFDLGAELASPPGGKFDVASIGPSHVAWLESRIDTHMEALQPLRAFLLPGGSARAAALHWARVVCRRAERAMLALHEHEPLRDPARTFINRLSDYLFAAARTANAQKGIADVEWHHQEEPC